MSINKLWKGVKNKGEQFVEEQGGVAGFLEKSLESVKEKVEMAKSFNPGSSSLVQCGQSSVRVERELAEGGFSTVYLCSSGGQSYALKKILAQTKEANRDARMEIKLLQSLNHKNIIKLVDCGFSDKEQRIREWLLLFEFIEKTVNDQIETKKIVSNDYDFNNVCTYGTPFSEVEALEVVMGVSEGLQHMHETLQVAHRDIKPHNVLLKYDGGGHDGGPTPIVMDVGSAMELDVVLRNKTDALNLEEEASQKCSAPYRPPELTSVSMDSVICHGADMWSVGCMLFALAFGYCPFEMPKEGVLKLGILNGTWSFPNKDDDTKNFSKGFKGLVSKLLSVNPRERGSAKECAQACKSLIAK